MSLIEKIKNIFKRNKEIEEIKEIPINTKFQKNRFENIRIYAPDLVMRDTETKDYTVQILDNDNNPIANEELEFYLEAKSYIKTTDENGYASLPVNLEARKYNLETTFPSKEEFAPRVRARVNVLRPDQALPRPYRLKNTILYVPNMVIYSQDEPLYAIRLTDNDENPIAGEKITFTVNDEEYEDITDEQGFVSFKLDLKIGSYKVEARFDGNDEYDEYNKSATIDIRKRIIDEKVMIEVENVAMEFKVSKDKIDTLKEYVIRTLKRDKKESKKVRILDDISFKIYKGEKVGLLGFNGAGKSTLLRIVTGIYEPTEGTVKIHGKIAPLLELSAGFDKNYTGKNNIFLNGSLLSMDENFLKEKYDEIVEFSELGEHINYPVKNYSKGMKAKLGFSIATLVNPEILIIDEILAVGDIKFRQKSSEKINSMMEEGVTVLLVSHSINQIRKICDRCIWISDGKVYMDGDSERVCDAYIKGAKK